MGVFFILHFVVYATQFALDLHVTTWLILLGGVFLLLRPAWHWVLALILPFLAVDAWMHMPVYSNHTILKNFLVLAMLFAGALSLLKRDGWDAWYDRFAPVGRVLLLIMYFFGVFHKINYDFINPDVSCALSLWAQMPWPLHLIDGLWFQYSAIYGTWVVEAIILVMILTPSWRRYGVIIGALFHMLLALSGYALYAPFSTLTVALHALFLSRGEADRLLSSLWIGWILHVLSRPISWFLLAVVMAVMGWSALLGNYGKFGFLWAVLLTPFVLGYGFSIWKYGRDEGEESLGLLSRPYILNFVSLLFLLNCITPYLGLKTAQSMNMFANLHLEGGYSNHIILSRPPAPFDYLADVVIVESASGSNMLHYIASENLGLTYYALLDQVSRYPGSIVSYYRNDVFFENAGYAELSSDIEEILHPLWFRKWFHFTPVDLNRPKICALNR